MTWVVGATTPFGYGVMVSDICVTLSDGIQRDVLRKAYPVGKFIIAGFAGSVGIGFDMIADLRDFLRMNETEAECCWEPEWVARNWSPRAKEVFRRQPITETKYGCEVMLVGVHAQEDALGHGRSVAAVLRWPDFEPDIETRWGAALSIGSGTGQHEAMEALVATVKDVDLMQAEVNNPGGFSRVIAFGMTHDLFFRAPVGVSRHLHVSIVGINRFDFRPNDLEFHPKDGDPVTLQMPKVAESYEQLCEMLKMGAEATRGLRAGAVRAPQGYPEHRRPRRPSPS